jgi:hypothetical protein
MPTDPELVPPNALLGKRVAISVSESADLPRLGLDRAHLELAIAELTRAVVFAGGIVVYGGRIGWGFTAVVLDEAERYGSSGCAFEHYVPYSEHSDMSHDDLEAYESKLSIKSRVMLLDSDGKAWRVGESAKACFARDEVTPADALSAMRIRTSEVSDARVVLGGRVSDFAGALPGVAEEAAQTAITGKPLFVAGGFGGAATLVGRMVNPDLYGWLPQDLPAGVTPEVNDAISGLLPERMAEDGLTDDERALLAQTNRASDVATLSILGLSRLSA